MQSLAVPACLVVMLAGRVVIHRWGWLVAALIAVTAVVLELSRDSPVERIHGSLDRAPIRRVTRGTDVLEPVPAPPPKLVVHSERPYYFGHVLGEAPVLPYWLESHHRDQVVFDFHGELDGSWIAIAGNTVFVIDG